MRRRRTRFALGICLAGILIAGLSVLAHLGSDRWHQVDAGPFVFLAPPALEEVDSTGCTDSYCGQCVSSDLHVEFDYGPFSDTLDEWSKSGSVEVVHIGGIRAKLGREGDPTEPGFYRSMAVNFSSADTHMAGLTMWIDYKKPGDEATARKILNSIRFRANGFKWPSPSWSQRFEYWFRMWRAR